MRLAELALGAIAAFNGDFVANLSADLSLRFCDEETGFPLSKPCPEHAFWYVRSTAASPAVASSPVWNGAREQSVAALDRSTLRGWIAGALERASRATAAGGMPVVWEELRSHANRVRLPDGLNPSSEVLALCYGSHVIHYPVERIDGVAWVSGPLVAKSLTSAIDMRVTNEAGFLTLEIHLFWSLWSDPVHPGWNELLRATQRLRDHGWALRFSSVPGIEA